MGYPVHYRGVRKPDVGRGGTGFPRWSPANDNEPVSNPFGRVPSNDNEFQFGGLARSLRRQGYWWLAGQLADIGAGYVEEYLARWSSVLGVYIPPGWVKTLDCGLFDKIAGNQLAPNCAFTGPWHDIPVGVNFALYKWTGQYLPNPALDVGPVGQNWQRVSGSRVDVAYLASYDQARYVPGAALNPRRLPIQKPSQAQKPLPWEVLPLLDDFPVDVPSHDAGYFARWDPVWQQEQNPVTGQDPDQGDDPQHEHRPARKGERERKFTVYGQGGALMNAYNWLTEARDFVSAVHYSLPMKDQAKSVYLRDPIGRWRKQGPNALDMASALYTHYDHIDMGKAFKNVIIQEIGDRVAAKLGKAQQRAARKQFESGYGQRPIAQAISRRAGPGSYGDGVPLGKWLSDNWPW